VIATKKREVEEREKGEHGYQKAKSELLRRRKATDCRKKI